MDWCYHVLRLLVALVVFLPLAFLVWLLVLLFDCLCGRWPGDWFVDRLEDRLDFDLGEVFELLLMPGKLTVSAVLMPGVISCSMDHGPMAIRTSRKVGWPM